MSHFKKTLFATILTSQLLFSVTITKGHEYKFEANRTCQNSSFKWYVKEKMGDGVYSDDKSFWFPPNSNWKGTYHLIAKEYCDSEVVVSNFIADIKDSNSSIDNKAPIFTCEPTVSVFEKQKSAITLTANDDSNITYSIINGDSDDFNLDKNSGLVTFKQEPIYDNKNKYQFRAVATDDYNNSSYIDITINIKKADNDNNESVINIPIGDEKKIAIEQTCDNANYEWLIQEEASDGSYSDTNHIWFPPNSNWKGTYHLIAKEYCDNNTNITNFIVNIGSNDTFSIKPLEEQYVSEYQYFDKSSFYNANMDKYYKTPVAKILGDSVGKVRYSIMGKDAKEFVLNPKTGELVLDYKDFEHPTDSNKDNIYEAKLIATDEANNSAKTDIKIHITDQEDYETKPYIILKGARLVKVKKGELYKDMGVKIVGDDNITVTKKIYGNYYLDPQLDKIDTNDSNHKVYHIIYYAKDNTNPSINIASEFRNVIVEDKTINKDVNITATSNDGTIKEFNSSEIDYIQKAIDFVHNHNGGVVHLNKGIHYFSKQLVMYSNIQLEGSLENSKIVSTLKLRDFTYRKSIKNSPLSYGNIYPLIVNSATDVDLLEDKNRQEGNVSKNITIKNLIIDGNREKQRSWRSAGDSRAIAISLKHTQNFVADRIKVINTLGDGINMHLSKDIVIKNSTFKFMGHSALYIINTNNVTVDNNTIDVVANSGIRFANGTDFNITNNHIFATTSDGNYGIQISANYTDKSMDHVNIEGNIIRHTAYAAIAIYSSNIKSIIQGVKIYNNIIYQSGTLVRDLSYISQKDKGSKIQEAGGINIQFVKDITIDHNTIFNNKGSGIRIDNLFYIPDNTQKVWNDMKELVSMPKVVSITNNVIVGNTVDEDDIKAYGIEKHIVKICDDNSDNICDSNTTVNIDHNIIANNKDGKVSQGLIANNNLEFNGFATENPYYTYSDGSKIEINLISYYYKSKEKNIDFTIDSNVGASNELIKKCKALYSKYREFFK